MSLDDIKSLIPISVPILELGVQPLNWSEVINIPENSSDPVTNLSLRLSGKSSNYYASAKLSSLTSSKHEDELKYHVLIRQTDKNYFDIYAVLKDPDTYALNIYLQKKTYEYESGFLCLSYLIHFSSRVNHDMRIGYPYVYTIPAEVFHFNLLYWGEAKASYICESSKQLFYSIFKAKSNLVFQHCLFQGRVEKIDISECDKYSTLLVNNGTGTYKLLALFPNRGWWTIHLAANSCGSNGEANGYTSLLNYQVYYSGTGAQDISFPRIHMPQEILFGSDPIIASDDKNSLTMIKFASKIPIEFCGYLTFGSKSAKLWEGYSNIEIDTRYNNQKYCHYKMNVTFPKPGQWFVHAFNGKSTSQTALFQIKLKSNFSDPKKLLVQSNPLLLEKYDITLDDAGVVTFMDDGEPFSFNFTAPCSGLEFLLDLKLPTDASADYSTFLSIPDKLDDKGIYSVNAVFPNIGKWSLELYSMKTGSRVYELVLFVKLNVTTPTSSYSYPIIYPAFHIFNFKIHPNNALIPLTSDSGEIRIPFQAPDGMYFQCKFDNNLTQQAFVHNVPDSQEKILHLLLPEPKQWKIQLYAKNLSEPDVALKPVFEVSMHNTACMKEYTFPLLFESSYEKYKISFSLSDLPLPSLLYVGKQPIKMVIRFNCPLTVAFRHQARVNSEISSKIFTRIVSDPDLGLYQLQFDVTQTGKWTVLLWAKDSNKDRDWDAIMQYTFSVVKK